MGYRVPLIAASSDAGRRTLSSRSGGLGRRDSRRRVGRGPPGQTGEFAFDTVYAFLLRNFMDESEDTLGFWIVYDGEVVDEAVQPPGRAT